MSDCAMHVFAFMLSDLGVFSIVFLPFGGYVVNAYIYCLAWLFIDYGVTQKFR